MNVLASSFQCCGYAATSAACAGYAMHMLETHKLCAQRRVALSWVPQRYYRDQSGGQASSEVCVVRLVSLLARAGSAEFGL
jgi:hypothetical protein